jgi:hypothetical protein
MANWLRGQLAQHVKCIDGFAGLRASCAYDRGRDAESNRRQAGIAAKLVQGLGAETLRVVFKIMSMGALLAQAKPRDDVPAYTVAKASKLWLAAL